MPKTDNKNCVSPLEACLRVEGLLRGTDTYHIAMDFPRCKLGLGKWLKRVIRNAKRQNVVTWITNELPDADMTVLMRLADPEHPVWPGFHDGESWCSADASTVEGPVLGWMELETAALLLDQSKTK